MSSTYRERAQQDIGERRVLDTEIPAPDCIRDVYNWGDTTYVLTRTSILRASDDGNVDRVPADPRFIGDCYRLLGDDQGMFLLGRTSLSVTLFGLFPGDPPEPLISLETRDALEIHLDESHVYLLSRPIVPGPRGSAKGPSRILRAPRTGGPVETLDGPTFDELRPTLLEAPSAEIRNPGTYSLRPVLAKIEDESGLYELLRARFLLLTTGAKLIHTEPASSRQTLLAKLSERFSLMPRHLGLTTGRVVLAYANNLFLIPKPERRV